MVNIIDTDLESELAEYLGETTISVGEPDWRANVAAGTVLAQGDIDGATVQYTKGRSMVSFNGKELPERTTVYDTRTGVSSNVPTAQLRYQLGKRRQDGSKVYSLKFPDGVKMPEPITETCQICFVNRGNRHRNFYSQDALINHMTAFHTLEWDAMEKDRDRQQRREDANRLERLILGLVTALNPGVTASLTDEVKAQISELQDAAPKRGRKASE